MYVDFISETRLAVGHMEINGLEHLTRIGGTSGSGGDPSKPPILNDIDLDLEGDAGKLYESRHYIVFFNFM